MQDVGKLDPELPEKAFGLHILDYVFFAHQAGPGYDDAGDGYGYEQGEYARCTLDWSEADAALRISAREGSYPGMAQEQTLRIRVFRPGAEPAEQNVRYTGEPLECKFQSTENR